MVISLIFSILLVICAGVCNAAMDIYTQKHFKSIFSKIKGNWFAEDSWKNKYKNRDFNQGEKFFGSTTFLVFITDFWHFAQFMWINFIFITLLLYPHNLLLENNILDILFAFICYRTLYLIVFNIFYERVFMLK